MDYAESNARYLRIRVTNNDEEPLRISGAQVSSVQVKPAQVTGYDMAITEVAEGLARRVLFLAQPGETD